MTAPVEHGECEGRVVVHVVGEIDIANSAELETTLEAAADGGRMLVVDLREVTFFDATGLTALLRARTSAVAKGGSLVLADVPRFLSRMLRITGLHSKLRVCCTRR